MRVPRKVASLLGRFRKRGINQAAARKNLDGGLNAPNVVANCVHSGRLEHVLLLGLAHAHCCGHKLSVFRRVGELDRLEDLLHKIESPLFVPYLIPNEPALFLAAISMTLARHAWTQILSWVELLLYVAFREGAVGGTGTGAWRAALFGAFRYEGGEACFFRRCLEHVDRKDFRGVMGRGFGAMEEKNTYEVP